MLVKNTQVSDNGWCFIYLGNVEWRWSDIQMTWNMHIAHADEQLFGGSDGVLVY